MFIGGSRLLLCVIGGWFLLVACGFADFGFVMIDFVRRVIVMGMVIICLLID